MGAIATLSAPALLVEPGAEVTCRLTVRNDGQAVDAYRVLAVGTPAAWASVEPPELRLMPGEEGALEVRFAPPRSWATPAGEHRFGLRVLSAEDPEGNTVEDGVISVVPFTDTGAELRPRTSTSRGRGAGRHEVAVDNRGNVAVTVALQPLDPDERLTFDLPAPVVEVAAGTTSVVPLAARARSRFWRGDPRVLPFQVHVEPAGSAPTTLDAQVVQGPAVPPWVWKALVALIVLATVLVALWLKVLRPSIEDSARSAAADVAAEAAQADEAQQAQIDALKQSEPVKSAPPPAPPTTPGAPTGPATKPSAGPTKKPSPTPTPSKEATPPGPPVVQQPTAPAVPPAAADPLGEPMMVRLAATSAVQDPSVVLSSVQQVSVTDMLLQNPAGDSGTLTLRRGSTVVYVTRLENFRDLDIHLVAPLRFSPKEQLRLDVACTNDPELAQPCTPSLTATGFARTPARP